MSYNENGAYCVGKVVRDIAIAQDEVLNNNNGNGCCSTSCERSIRDLLTSPENGNANNGFTTIPFILYCKGACNPFISSGIFKVV